MRFKVCATALLSLTLVAPLGCATVQRNPSDTAIGEVRAIAQDVSAGVRTGLGIANQTGAFIAELPVSTAVKNDYDCAVVRVTGTTVPRPNLLTVCGPNTPQGPGPLNAALDKLKAVTSRPNLVATVNEIKLVIEPLIVKLETSEAPALRAFAASLRIAFVLVLSGGVQ